VNADEDSPQEIEDALLRLGSATLGESGAQTADPRLRPAWVGAALAGPAYPVSCTGGDNLAVHVGVREAPAGSVLVVDVGTVPDRGYWGEVLTTAAESAGLRGLVIDGGVRDVAALEAHRFPVFSSTIAARGATKDQPGTVGSAVMVGGVLVHRGDWVVGDVDGVTVIPATSLEAVRRAGDARAAQEKEMFGALRAGKSTIELFHLDTSPVIVTDTQEGTHSG
jgi:4-hydroxy-4-methyl-2-oxoglutarate aldolase